MLKKIGIAGCVLTAALAVMPAGAFAEDRDDWHRHDRDDRRYAAPYRDDGWRNREVREWREHERREWRERERREQVRRGYYDRYGNWRWY